MPRTVLVIEDDVLNMKLMRSLLGIGGFDILEAGDAETGLKLAAEHHPDLVLMDIQLPGLDGLSATRQLKASPELGTIPVIALTGLAMEGDRDRALAAGCDDYITKPINTRSFLESIGQHLAHPPEAGAGAPAALAAPQALGRILVVDDDPRNVKLLTATLTQAGYACLAAYGGEEALRLTREQQPDLLLLDIMMPLIDGYQVVRTLKADSKTAGIPIIMITALNGREDKDHALREGADEFLSKPVNRAELLARVKSMLRLSRYREQLTLRTRSEEHLTDSLSTQRAAVSHPRQRVLLVEDSEKDQRLLADHLAGQDFDLRLTRDGEVALQLAQEAAVDLILLDIFLPGVDGFEVCQRLKSRPATRDIQVVLITSLNDLEGRIRGAELGADDYLVKPVDRRELLARVRALLDKKSYLDRLHVHYTQALTSAISDGLTGLYNQSYLKRFLDLELKRGGRQHYSTSLLMLDLDDFKQLNDRYGHPTGDYVLHEIGRILKNQIREMDLAARYGGEEFAIVLPYAESGGAMAVAERILEAVRNWRPEPLVSAPAQGITLSIGLAVFPAHGGDAEALLQAADAALYRAKTHGKNRIELYSAVSE